jgi:transcriptional regulator with XRE-family HTH domain
MKPIAEIIAENLVALRKKCNLTQNDLAEKLKYSDNTISRWEHAEITPSIETLEKISEIYEVPLESLLKENISHTLDKQEKTRRVSQICTALLIVMAVWLCAIAVFVYGQTVIGNNLWTLFIWAIPISCVVLMLFYDNKIYRFVLSTVLLWTLLLAVFLEFYKYKFWLIFFTGIPVQIVCVIWTFIKPRTNSHKNKQ